MYSWCVMFPELHATHQGGTGYELKMAKGAKYVQSFSIAFCCDLIICTFTLHVCGQYVTHFILESHFVVVDVYFNITVVTLK